MNTHFLLLPTVSFGSFFIIIGCKTMDWTLAKRSLKTNHISFGRRTDAFLTLSRLWNTRPIVYQMISSNLIHQSTVSFKTSWLISKVYCRRCTSVGKRITKGLPKSSIFEPLTKGQNTILLCSTLCLWLPKFWIKYNLSVLYSNTSYDSSFFNHYKKNCFCPQYVVEHI